MIRTVRAMSSLTALNSGVSALVLASVALGAAWMAHQGTITVGNFVTVVGLSRVIAGPMETLGFFGAELAQSEAPRADCQNCWPSPADQIAALHGRDRLRQK